MPLNFAITFTCKDQGLVRAHVCVINGGISAGLLVGEEGQGFWAALYDAEGPLRRVMREPLACAIRSVAEKAGDSTAPWPPEDLNLRLTSEPKDAVLSQVRARMRKDWDNKQDRGEAAIHAHLGAGRHGDGGLDAVQRVLGKKRSRAAEILREAWGSGRQLHPCRSCGTEGTAG